MSHAAVNLSDPKVFSTQAVMLVDLLYESSPYLPMLKGKEQSWVENGLSCSYTMLSI